ncbi:hypothetical protein Tco_0934304, partial [Tanacetum coccineum]
LEAFSDSDYGGASLDRKSTTGGCQFLGRRLISWQCKKHPIMANSTTEAEYVAAANCCGQVLWIHNQMMDYGFNFMNTKIHIDNERTISVIKNPVAHSKTKHIEIQFHFIRDCYEKILIEDIKIHTNSNVADLLTKDLMSQDLTFWCYLGSRESLERDMDGTAEFLLSNLFDFWLTKVSTDRQTLYSYKSVRENTATNQKYKFSKLIFGAMIRHLDATKKFVMYPRFLQIFLSDQLKDVPVPLDHFPVPTLTKKVLTFMVKKGKNFSGKVTPLFNFMLVQQIEDEDEALERPSDSQPIPSPPHSSEDQPQTQSAPSPRPFPSIAVPDSNLEGSGGNHGGQSSNNESLPGNEDGLTLQSVYDLCMSLCKQVITQAKEIKDLKAQVKKLKKGVKPLITHHKAWMKTRLARKTSLKKRGVHKEYVSKQGRKSIKTFKGEPFMHKDLAFDDFVDMDDTLDYMETEDVQDERRNEGTNTRNEGTDKGNEGTDKQDGGTDSIKVSTDRQGEGIADQDEGKSVTQTPTSTPNPTTPIPTVFGDDETIAQVHIILSQNKEKLKEKEKGIDPKDKGKKRIEEEDESDTESEGITEAEKKFKQLANDEEVARKVQEEWEAEEEKKRLVEEEATKAALSNEYDFIHERLNADKILAEELQKEEREKFTFEQRAKFLHDTIAAQRKFLAQQRSEAIKNKPPIRNQLRNQMMTYLKHNFVAIGSAEDERQIKEMNKESKDLEKKRLKKMVVNEEDTTKVPAKQEATKQGTKKRKSGHVKMIAGKRPRPQPDDDSDDEHRKCLRIVTFEGTIDSEFMETKSFIARLHKVSSPDGNYLVVYRVNRHFRAFNYLMEGDLKIMMESSTEENDQGLEVEEETTAALQLVRFVKQQLNEEYC